MPNPGPESAPDSPECLDENIFCPVCNYNLTGIRSGRCPECGALFDREVFLQTQQTNGVILIPWDDPRIRSPITRWKSTLSVCLLQPEKFARAFSVQRADTRAWKFLRLILLVTTLPVCIGQTAVSPFSTFGSFPWWHFVLLVFLYLNFACLGFALATSGVLWIFCTHYDGKRHLAPWLAISAYSAAHSLLIFPVCLLVPFIIIARKYFDPDLLLLGLTAVFHYGALCLNALTLNGVVKHRTAKHRQSTFAPLALLLIVNIVPVAAWLTATLIAREIVRIVQLFQQYQ